MADLKLSIQESVLLDLALFTVREAQSGGSISDESALLADRLRQFMADEFGVLESIAAASKMAYRNNKEEPLRD